MHFMNVSGIFAQAQQQTPQPNMLMTVVPMVLLFIIFYFVLIRPQQKKAKEQAEMLKTIKSGDKVVTSSGIIATVITVKEDSISIRSADAKMEVTKGSIAEIRERSGESNAS